MRRELILDTRIAKTDYQLHATKPLADLLMRRPADLLIPYFFFASFASAAGAAAAGAAAASVLPFLATSGSVGAAATSSTGATSSLMIVTCATVAFSSPRNLMLPECGRSET